MKLFKMLISKNLYKFVTNLHPSKVNTASLHNWIVEIYFTK